MTNIADGSDQILFRGKDEVAGYILDGILANRKRKIGTEIEMFLVDGNGRAISCSDGQKAFAEFKRVFALRGYDSFLIYEQDAEGRKTIFGLDVPGLGTITPEIGHQFEFSSSVCETAEEIREKNSEFFCAVREVAARMGFFPVFCGHIPGYVETTEGSYRSRSIEWHRYFKSRFGADSLPVCETLDATASTQVSLDSGGERFHEFFQALLLIEPAFSLHYANSLRRHVGVTQMLPSHIKPITSVWRAGSAKEAVEHIVDRLMYLEVPFLPDPEHPQIYKAEPLLGRCPPTVEDLMFHGRLNGKILNNVGGFLLSRPAVRRFSQGILEMRGVDAQDSPEKVAEIAQRVMTLVYNDEVRKDLLSSYEHLNVFDIAMMHKAASLPNLQEALDFQVAGIKMSDFIDDVFDRSETVETPPVYFNACEYMATA